MSKGYSRIADSLEATNRKPIRRHPHIFDEAQAERLFRVADI